MWIGEVPVAYVWIHKERRWSSYYRYQECNPDQAILRLLHTRAEQPSRFVLGVFPIILGHMRIFQ